MHGMLFPMSLIDNPKVRFNFEILETFEAGLVLLGTEVKSLRAGRGKLEGSHVVVRGGETFLVGADIPAYQQKNASAGYDPTRARALLLTKEQQAIILKASDTKGLTIVPLSVYNKGRKLKLSIAIARGKKKFDKREAIKKRDTERDVKRELKHRM